MKKIKEEEIILNYKDEQIMDRTDYMEHKKQMLEDELKFIEKFYK